MTITYIVDDRRNIALTSFFPLSLFFPVPHVSFVLFRGYAVSVDLGW